MNHDTTATTPYYLRKWRGDEWRGLAIKVTQVQTTARYAHLAADPAQAAAEQVTSSIATILDGGVHARQRGGDQDRRSIS